MRNKLLLSGLILSSQWMVAQDRPNIIMFLVDDMGLMDTSLPFDVDAQGNAWANPLNEWYHTPNMERLAQTGIRFSTFYAQSVSSPSRVSLMTGQNATRHGVTNWINAESNNRDQYGPRDWNWKGLKKADVTLPKLLHQADYKTIHVGKAHFGCLNSEGVDPLNLGFDVNVGGCAHGHPGSYLGEDGYGKIKGDPRRAVPDLEKYHGTDTFLTEALTKEAIAQMDAALAENRHFYLNMAHYAVHSPFMMDKRFAQHYANMGKSEQAQAFATLIEGMDKSLGDILDYLEEKGIADNTLVVFMGDNGGDAPLGEARGYGSSEPFRGKKGSEFEGGMRVPCIVSWAKPVKRNRFQKALPIASGKISTQMGCIMDIYPTLAEVAGVTVPETHKVDGKSLAKMLTGEFDETHDDAFLMHFPHRHRGSYFTVYREGDWKLVYYYNPEHSERPECILYNLKDDPYEHHEISAANPEKTMYMLKRMIERLDKEGARYPINYEGDTVKPVVSFFEEKFKVQ